MNGNGNGSRRVGRIQQHAARMLDEKKMLLGFLDRGATLNEICVACGWSKQLAVARIRKFGLVSARQVRSAMWGAKMFAAKPANGNGHGNGNGSLPIHSPLVERRAQRAEGPELKAFPHLRLPTEFPPVEGSGPCEEKGCAFRRTVGRWCRQHFMDRFVNSSSLVGSSLQPRDADVADGWW